MNTPKEYRDNLEHGVITKQMCYESLFSVNKRIENCTAQEQKYYKLSYRSDIYHCERNYRSNREEFLKQQMKLLSLFDSEGILEGYMFYEQVRAYHDITDLISAQFVGDLLELVDSGEYSFTA